MTITVITALPWPFVAFTGAFVGVSLVPLTRCGVVLGVTDKFDSGNVNEGEAWTGFFDSDSAPPNALAAMHGKSLKAPDFRGFLLEWPARTSRSAG